jgi:hypothetical protein
MTKCSEVKSRAKIITDDADWRAKIDLVLVGERDDELMFDNRLQNYVNNPFFSFVQ